MSHTISNEVTEGEEVKVEVKLFSGPDEGYAMEFWYDRAFGTVAFARRPLNRQGIRGERK